MTAAKTSFATATRDLERLAGLKLSESTVQRVAEAIGRRLGERLDLGELFGAPVVWDWNRDAGGKTCAYVSVDATGIGMQGPGGAKAEGRMPYVAMVYNPTPRDELGVEAGGGRQGQVRYLAGLTSLETLGPALRAQAGHVGMDAAEQWICLSDGGSGLDAYFETNFPRGQRILDFWHAAQNLAEFVKLLHPSNAAEEKAQFDEWRRTLRQEGGLAVLRLILNTFVQDRSAEVQDRHRRLLEYVRSNVHRMDYPTYTSNGWRIGSGPVEAACKTVVNARLDQSGMRWGEEGADGVCRLRALYRSEPTQWAAFWREASRPNIAVTV